MKKYVISEQFIVSLYRQAMREGIRRYSYIDENDEEVVGDGDTTLAQALLLLDKEEIVVDASAGEGDIEEVEYSPGEE